jgi:glycerol-3-phosphate dehydrogenase (NAD(P)+)
MIRGIGVIGGGAWGTALAAVAQAADDGPVVLWARESDVVESINRDHRNAIFLPGIDLDPRIRASGALTDLAAMDALLLVAPAQHVRAVCAALAPAIRPTTPIVICAKGVEQPHGDMLSDIVAAILPRAPLAVLSGPTFADEVARGLPAAVTLAAGDAELGRQLQERLGRPMFRTYLSNDIVGAQIGGAVKNVLAIACGVVEGLNLGRNARAALMTRGLVEIVRLGQAMGAKLETLLGLCGMGDLVLTCSSEQSRNFSLGLALGQGRKLADVLGQRVSVAEGVTSAPAVLALAGRHGVEMPICAAVNGVLHQGASLRAAINGLLSRPFKAEWPA